MAVKKNYFYHVILSGVNILYPLITFPYVARVLQPVGLGQAQFAFNFALYFSVLASFGIPFYGIKEIARSRRENGKLDRTFSELISINGITALISLALYAISIAFIPNLAINLSFAVVCGALVFFAPLNIDWFFAGLEEYRITALRSVLIKVLALILLYSFVKTDADILIYLMILTFSYIGNYLINIFLIKGKVKLSFKGMDLSQHRKPLLFILSSTFAATIYTSLDSVVLGLLSDNYQVGLYSAGVKLSKVSIPIVTGLSAVLIPSISEAIKKKDQAYEARMVSRSFSFIIFLGIPIAFGLFTFRALFINVLLGQAYIDAMPSMAYLSFLPLFIGLGYLFGLQVLVPNGLNRSLFIATMFGVLAFIIANLLFTSKLGSMGAAISILVTEIIVTIAYIKFCPKYLIKKLPLKDVLFATIASSGFIAVFYLIEALAIAPVPALILSITLSIGLYFSIQHYVFSNTLVQLLIGTIKSRLRR